jgi:hypothetical protein
MKTIEEQLQERKEGDNLDQCVECDNKDKCYCRPVGECTKGVAIAHFKDRKKPKPVFKDATP